MGHPPIGSTPPPAEHYHETPTGPVAAPLTPKSNAAQARDSIKLAAIAQGRAVRDAGAATLYSLGSLLNKSKKLSDRAAGALHEKGHPKFAGGFKSVAASLEKAKHYTEHVAPKVGTQRPPTQP